MVCYNMTGMVSDGTSGQIVSRRRYLGSISTAAGALALAGCVDDSSDESGATTTTADDSNNGGGETIRLGTLAPNSGTFSSSGPYVTAGARLAVEQINEEGGIGGTDVEVVVADTQTTPKAGASAATRLIQQESVDFLTGAVSSGVGLAVTDIAEDNRVPYMSGIASLDFGTNTCPRYVYANNPSTNMTANAYLPYFNDKGASSFYFITADYAWGQNASDYYKELVSRLGAEFAGESFAPFGNSDFSSQISSAMNSNADALILTLYGQDIVKCVNQLTRYNAREQFNYIATIVNSITLNRGMNELEGFYFGGKYYWDVESKRNRQFVERFESSEGEKPPMPAALQYGSTYEMLRAAQEVGSANADDVAAQMEGWTTEPYYKGGTATFRACDHRLVSDIFLMEGKAQSARESENDLLDVVERFDGEGLARDCSQTCGDLPAWS